MHVFLESKDPEVFGKAGHMLDSLILHKKQIEDKLQHTKREVPFLTTKDKPVFAVQ